MEISNKRNLEVETIFLLGGSAECLVCNKRFWFEKFYATKLRHWKGDGVCKRCATSVEHADEVLKAIPFPEPPTRLNH